MGQWREGRCFSGFSKQLFQKRVLNFTMRDEALSAPISPIPKHFRNSQNLLVDSYSLSSSPEQVLDFCGKVGHCMEKEADMERTLPSVSSRNKILSRFGVTGFELLLNNEEAGTPLPLGSMRMA